MPNSSTAPGRVPPRFRGSNPTSTTGWTELAEEGVTGVMLAPIGFISDHMEVAFDLDTEAKETAEKLGFAFTRVATVGTHEDIRLRSRRPRRGARGQLRGDAVEAPALPGTTALVPGSGACSIECCRGRIERATHPNWGVS
jgi:ferrochelatase